MIQGRAREADGRLGGRESRDAWDGARARDLIVEHFHAEHRGVFASARLRLGATAGAAEVFEAVVGAVRLVFRSVGADFSNPTREDLLSVVEALARKAAVWGTPPYAVERQSRRMVSAIDRAGARPEPGRDAPSHVPC